MTKSNDTEVATALATVYGVLNIMYASYQALREAALLPRRAREMVRSRSWGDRLLLRMSIENAQLLPQRLQERRRHLTLSLYREAYPHLLRVQRLSRHVGHAAVDAFPQSEAARELSRDLHKGPTIITPAQLEALAHLPEAEILERIRRGYYAEPQRAVRHAPEPTDTSDPAAH